MCMFTRQFCTNFVTGSELTTAQHCLLLDNTVYYNTVPELEESIKVIKIKNREITC